MPDTELAHAYPGRHWELDADGQPTNRLIESRRRSDTDHQWLRGYVDTWRALPNPQEGQVTPETARLLQHWRHHQFRGARPFFCQIEAVETAIWLTEVAAKLEASGKKFREHLAGASAMSNPELFRVALKLATGTG